jgi:23S rRNA (cytosine1962-C5)-methyltransferase
MITNLQLLAPPPWPDYELLDTGAGAKLERFGEVIVVRPESQAVWAQSLSEREWQRADATFEKTRSDDGPGQWRTRRPLPEQWSMHYENLRFGVRLTPFRHTGVFPEHSAHWGWMQRQITTRSDARVLVLFGYTGLTSLAAASYGAHVTHVDASKPALLWAQANQQRSGLAQRPIRWLIDDVGKFVAREERRGNRYDLIVLDPPVFGRGPNGEVWRLHEQLLDLMERCGALLSTQPLGLLLNAYATNLSALTLYNVMTTVMQQHRGKVAAGELVLPERASGRLLPTARYAYWSS